MLNEPGDAWLQSYLNRQDAEQEEHERLLDERVGGNEYVLKPNGDANCVDDYVLIEDIPLEDRWIYGLEED